MSDTVTLSREVVESARFIAMVYAASNQKWDYAGKMQDPGGAHACYEALKAALAAPQPEPQPVKPANDDEVICPQCCNQFRAIPVNVQQLLLDAGFEPPFKGAKP